MKREKMFEFALKNKLRFNFKGVLNTEDLFDLSLEDLDSIYKNLNSRVKESGEESLLGTKTKVDEELEIQINIVKYIVEDKLEERDRISKEREIRKQKQKIMEIIADKEDSELEGKSIDELKAMLNDLD